MFVSSQTHTNVAPEILDGAHQSAPRSWNNLRRWSVRKDLASTAHQEQGRSGMGSTSTTPIYNISTHQDSSEQRRQRNPTVLSTLKHAAVFIVFSFPIIFLALVVKVPKWYAFEADYWVSNSFTHCNFNGRFTPEDKPTLSLWDPSGFFYITVSWGKMAFSTAKFIDIVWDIVVGRGGQAFLALITFKISSQYLAVAMREAPVSYNTFESLAFVPPSVIRTGRLAGDLLTNRGWRARLIIVWIVLSSLFVLSFSSLITAMSGYSSNIDAVMPNHDNESTLWSNYLVVQFAINDAQRIGHDEPLYITTAHTCVQQGFLDDDDNSDSGIYHDEENGSTTSKGRTRRDDDDDDEQDGDDADSSGEVPWEYVPKNCTTFWRVVQYVSTYGLDGRNHTESTIKLNGTTHSIAAPALNITTSYSQVSLSTLETYLDTFSVASPPATGSLSSVSHFTDSTFWVYDDEIYSFSYVLDNAACQYSRLHNWGFSFLFLFITSLLLAVWSVGMYALWLYTYLHGSPDPPPGQHTTCGMYRSSWTLVEAMKRDVGPGAVIPEMQEREIRNLVRRRRGHVIYGVGNIDGQPPQLFSRSEKNLAPSPSITSPQGDLSTNRFAAFRNWLFPSTRPHERSINAIQTPANSIFTHVTPTFSSTSEYPILQSPAAPGRTMTMTSRLSSLASPFADSPPEFGFSPAAETDILNSPRIAPFNTTTPFSTPTVGGAPGRTRPRLSLSRAIRSSTYGAGNNPHAASTTSASPTARWITSPGEVSPSADSSSSISPVRDYEKGRGGYRGRDEDAVRWRNDLGDD